jgi:hypothetical protein
MRFAPFSYFCTCWNVERIAECCLGHTKHQASRAHPRPDMFVSWLYSALWHRAPVPLVAVQGDYTTCRSGEMGRLVGDGLQNGRRVGARGWEPAMFWGVVLVS